MTGRNGKGEIIFASNMSGDKWRRLNGVIEPTSPRRHRGIIRGFLLGLGFAMLFWAALVIAGVE